jgi:Tol biopolymer transport system component
LSQRGLPTFGATSWSFTIGAGRLAYLWPADQPADMFAWSPADEEPRMLVEAEGGILDFNLTFDGGSVVYSVATPTGSEIRASTLAGSDNRLIHRCPIDTTCRSASLSPDGAWLAYLQEEPQPDGTTLRRVWVKGLPDGEAYTVAPEDHASSQPVWSSQGWLAIYDQAVRGYGLYRRMEDEGALLDFLVPNELGETPAWSPDGENLVFAEMLFLPEAAFADSEEPPRYYSHLNQVSIVDGRQVDLSGEQALLVEDAGPVYSPDGLWIAFSRRFLDSARWTLGRQVWLMRADGSEPTQRTDVPALNHAGLTWSSDSARLAYLLFDQARAGDPSEIWWMWADGRPGGRVVAGGYAPEWIP